LKAALSLEKLQAVFFNYLPLLPRVSLHVVAVIL